MHMTSFIYNWLLALLMRCGLSQPLSARGHAWRALQGRKRNMMKSFRLLSLPQPAASLATSAALSALQRVDHEAKLGKWVNGTRT